MKCAYEAKMEEQAQQEAHEKLEDTCYDLGMKWLAFVEALVENVAAEQFGVGRSKLKQMREETEDDLTYYMSFYSDITGELWETTQDTAYGLLLRLKGIGVDLKELAEQYKVPDVFSQYWHTEKDIELHQWKIDYIANMETKLSVYWAVILLWWNNSEGYGASRLIRYYKAIRERYNVFAAVYLRSKPAWKKELDKLIAKEQEMLEKRGVELEVIPERENTSEPVETAPLIPESKEFIEKAIKLFDNLRPTHRF